jgi:hypothetical protein
MHLELIINGTWMLRLILASQNTLLRFLDCVKTQQMIANICLVGDIPASALGSCF